MHASNTSEHALLSTSRLGGRGGSGAIYRKQEAGPCTTDGKRQGGARCNGQAPAAHALSKPRRQRQSLLTEPLCRMGKRTCGIPYAMSRQSPCTEISINWKRQ